jgi:hypothetical protein
MDGADTRLEEPIEYAPFSDAHPFLLAREARKSPQTWAYRLESRGIILVVESAAGPRSAEKRRGFARWQTGPLSVTGTDRKVTQIGWSARKRVAQSALKRAAMQPKINLHSEPGVLYRVVQVTSTSELDVAADRAQRGAVAAIERSVPLHGAIDRPGQRGQAR